MTKVALVVGGGLVGAGLRALFEESAEVVVIGEIGLHDQATVEIDRMRPDVVIADVDLPERDSERLLQLLLERAERIPPVLLLATTLSERVVDLVQAGAQGVLLKRDGSAGLVAAIRMIVAGYGVLCSPMLGRVRGCSITTAALRTRGHSLSRREAQVLALIGRGMNNAEIAEVLVVEDSTVKSHIKHILRKLGLRDRTQAAIFACQRTVVVGV